MAYNKTVMFFFQKPENYYRQDFVRKIRAEKNGYEYLTLYEELLIESLNKDGVLANFFDDKIVPYTTKELSIIFNHRETIIKNGLELFQKYKIVEKKDAVYIDVHDYDKTGEYKKCFTLVIKYGTTVIKVLPEDKVDIQTLISRIKCQMRKYQFCIRCTACDSTCPHGAIDTIHGKYTIDENKCQHCKHCVAKFYNGCIMCSVLTAKKE